MNRFLQFNPVGVDNISSLADFYSSNELKDRKCFLNSL
jgi:hypothetical protein